MDEPILSIRGLTKTYRNGPRALDNVDLDIRAGEIFALLGPNGAGKTTLIGAVCGLVRPTGGTITAFGHDLARDWRAARARIGLVPQELATDMFETVWRAVSYSQGLFGKPRNPARIEEILRSLSLWDKKDAQIRALSGGMKRRVLIAKALAHEPELLFLDEPTAGVDVELRKDMWEQIAALKQRGVTIILAPLGELPEALAGFGAVLSEGGTRLTYRGGNGQGRGRAEVAQLAQALTRAGIGFTSLDIHDSSLEDIFVGLLGQEQDAA